MKNWYNEERLIVFKLCVNRGTFKQEDYEKLEKMMNNFNLEDKQIIEKVIDYFLEIECGKEVSFSLILSKCFDISALHFFGSDNLFNLFNIFLKECKKRKIEIRFQKDLGEVELPYNLFFCRVEKREIKKIVYNEMYGCYGALDELSRKYVVFEPEKITYCCEPLRKYPSKKNCLIKISYCPLNDDKLYKSRYNNIDEEVKYDFDGLCNVVKKIINSPETESFICDAISATLDIYYANGKKQSTSNLYSDEGEFIDKIATIFTPESFKKATNSEDEE